MLVVFEDIMNVNQFQKKRKKRENDSTKREYDRDNWIQRRLCDSDDQDERLQKLTTAAL